MKRLLLPMLAFALAAPAYAQSYSEIPQEYAYGSALDVQGGVSVMPYSVAGDKRTAFGAASGGDFQLRYTYYFNRHWGIFCSFSFIESDFDQKEYFGVVNRADGNLYRYKVLPRIDFTDIYEGPGSSTSYTSGTALTVGAAYRYDFGHWSLRPRAGMGIGSYDAQTVAYKRTPRDGGKPSAVAYNVSKKSVDYLEDSSDYGSGLNAVFSAALQMTYTFSRHFYISAECGFRCFANGYRYERVRYSYKDAFEPTNWAESVGMSELEGKYVIDQKSAVTESARLPRNFFNFSFGIGWNLGRNRYQSGKYSK